MASSNTAIGLFLIIIGLITFITSMPLLVNSVDTGNHSAYENNSDLFKSIVSNYPIFIAVMAIVIIFAGVKLAVG